MGKYTIVRIKQNVRIIQGWHYLGSTVVIYRRTCLLVTCTNDAIARLSTENLLTFLTFFTFFFGGETFLTFLFFWKTFLNLFFDEKNLFFQDFCGKGINFCFFLVKFLSAHHVLNWAGLSVRLYAFCLGAGIVHHLVHAEKWAKGWPGLPLIVGSPY